MFDQFSMDFFHDTFGPPWQVGPVGIMQPISKEVPLGWSHGAIGTPPYLEEL